MFAIVLLMTIANFFFRVTYNYNTVINKPVDKDALEYLTYAQNLKNYGVFSKSHTSDPQPDSYRAPGYPLILYLVIFFSGGALTER